MRLNKPIIDHCALDIELLVDAISGLDPDQWKQSSATRTRLAGTRSGSSMILQTQRPYFENRQPPDVIIQLKTSGIAHSFKDPRFSDLWKIVEKQILKKIGRLYPDADVMGVQFTSLPAAASIEPHADRGMLTLMHRLHVPIITHPDVIFGFDDYSCHLEAGRLFELNNQVTHAVYNRSKVDRVHLMIDLMPHRTARVKVHINPQEYINATK